MEGPPHGVGGHGGSRKCVCRYVVYEEQKCRHRKGLAKFKMWQLVQNKTVGMGYMSVQLSEKKKRVLAQCRCVVTYSTSSILINAAQGMELF